MHTSIANKGGVIVEERERESNKIEKKFLNYVICIVGLNGNLYNGSGRTDHVEHRMGVGSCILNIGSG